MAEVVWLSVVVKATLTPKSRPAWVASLRSKVPPALKLMLVDLELALPWVLLQVDLMNMLSVMACLQPFWGKNLLAYLIVRRRRCFRQSLASRGHRRFR